MNDLRQMMSSLFSIQMLKVVLIFLGAVIACPVQSQTPPQTQAEAAAVLAGELLSMYKGTEITMMDDKTAHLRGFHALDEVIGDDMWRVFVWLDDNCTIRASAAQSWENVAERRLEVRLDLLKADEAYFGPGGTFTVLGNGRDPPVCMQIPAKSPKCRIVAARQFCRKATPADMFCLNNLRIDNPFSKEDALDHAVRAISLLRQYCSPQQLFLKPR